MAKQSGGNTAQRVEALVRPTVEGMGLRLWDVVFEKEGPDWYLRVLIDKDGTMDTDTCADVSHALDPIHIQLRRKYTRHRLEAVVALPVQLYCFLLFLRHDEPVLSFSPFLLSLKRNSRSWLCSPQTAL